MGIFVSESNLVCNKSWTSLSSPTGSLSGMDIEGFTSVFGYTNMETGINNKSLFWACMWPWRPPFMLLIFSEEHNCLHIPLGEPSSVPMSHTILDVVQKWFSCHISFHNMSFFLNTKLIDWDQKSLLKGSSLRYKIFSSIKTIGIAGVINNVLQSWHITSLLWSCENGLTLTIHG